MQKTESNEATFRRLKASIDRDHPRGHWIAINSGRIIADAPTIDELTEALQASGQDSVHVFVARAGMDYPEEVTILIADSTP